MNRPKRPTAALLLACATLAGGAQAPAPAPSRGPKYGAAPYLATGDRPPNVARVIPATGQRAFTLAFILAPNGGGCLPTWDGTRPLATDRVAPPIIAAVRAAGGDVVVAAGGYSGTKLGQACPDAAATAAAYQQVIDRYTLKAMDFDLEGPELDDSAAVARELGAVAVLQRANPGLAVSVTIPGTPDGTSPAGRRALAAARAAGVTDATFSIMPFDGGFRGAASQIAALERFHRTLTAVFAWDAPTAYRRMGVSLMNGRTDAGEHFTLADFAAVRDYARARGLGRYTFWSVGRDRACPGNADVLSPSCSGVAQRDWAFTRLTATF